MKLDITIVSGYRPDLLERTLVSFEDKIFSNFDIGQVYANIDPFCGEKKDGDRCEAILKDRFSDIQITRPLEPSFGKAVKTLWQKPQSKCFLHLEDDWQVLHPILPEDIFPRLVEEVVQVQLSAINKHYLPHKFSYKVSWRNTLGLKLFKKTHFDRPLFSTSPSFYKSSFARECSSMMDPNKDPEKQLYESGKLAEFTKSFRNWPLSAPDQSPIVLDLGRPWLEGKGMRKRIIDGVSIWEKV